MTDMRERIAQAAQAAFLGDAEASTKHWEAEETRSTWLRVADAALGEIGKEVVADRRSRKESKYIAPRNKVLVRGIIRAREIEQLTFVEIGRRYQMSSVRACIAYHRWLEWSKIDPRMRLNNMGGE